MPLALALGLVDQAVVDGVESKFQAVGNAELVEDVVQVILHGLLADEKLFADFLVAKTLATSWTISFSRSLSSGFSRRGPDRRSSRTPS